MRANIDRHVSPNTRWPTAPLKRVVKKLFVGLPVSRYTAKAGEKNVIVPVLSVGDIESDHIVPISAISTAQIRATEDVERFRIRAEDVVVSCRGTLLKVAAVRHDGEGILASSNIITVRPDTSIVLPQILLALFRTEALQDLLKSRSRSATGLMQLTVKDLADLPVPILPLGVQTKVAELIEVEERAYRTALAVAERRRTMVQSLVTRALLGTTSETSG